MPNPEVILLVDDDEMVRAVVKRMLELRGYSIIEAHNGQDGLRRLEEGADGIDLLLTDICMPVLDGWQLAEGARKLRADLKIMFMSGQCPEFSEAGPGNRKVVFLQKPFSAVHLANKVRETLDDEHGAAASA